MCHKLILIYYILSNQAKHGHGLISEVTGGHRQRTYPPKTRGAVTWKLVLAARTNSLTNSHPCTLCLIQCGKTQIQCRHSQHDQPTRNLCRQIARGEQKRPLQTQVPDEAWCHRALGRYGTALEACFRSTENIAQLVPCPPHWGQHEPNEE